MVGLLMFVPAAVSLILGTVHLFASESGPGLKSLVVILFVAAVVLQFRSSFPLVGLLLQAGLALGLATWWKLSTGAQGS
jgi:chromate transport protein ChrA